MKYHMDALLPKPNIKELVTQLLADDLVYEESVDIINQIHSCFNEITSISGYDMEFKHLAAVPTASGMALSINHAAQCLLDYTRTIKFLKGLVKAIKDAQQENPNKTIQVFYAGCGPYAPFVTLVAPLFDISEVQFSLLEINEESLNCAKKLIDELSLGGYIKEYYRADAVTFSIPKPDTIHILYSETLDALLFRESYVPILVHMLPQLPEKIKVIPNNVVLKVDAISDNTSTNIITHTIFDTREAVRNISVALPNKFPSTQIQPDSSNNITHIIIDTEVHIYEHLKLTRGESSLTIPFEIVLENPFPHNTISFTYQLKPQVGLKYEFL